MLVTGMAERVLACRKRRNRNSRASLFTSRLWDQLRGKPAGFLGTDGTVKDGWRRAEAMWRSLNADQTCRVVLGILRPKKGGGLNDAGSAADRICRSRTRDPDRRSLRPAKSNRFRPTSGLDRDRLSGARATRQTAGRTDRRADPRSSDPPIRSPRLCRGCGMRRGQTLRRHIADHGPSVEQYRIRWNLPHDHASVAPAYSEGRPTMAKQLGLGQRGRRSRTAPPETPTPPRRPGRPRTPRS